MEEMRMGIGIRGAGMGLGLLKRMAGSTVAVVGVAVVGVVASCTRYLRRYCRTVPSSTKCLPR
jgi:hypothetical protein